MRSPLRHLVWPVALTVAVLVGGVLSTSPGTTYGGASEELFWLQVLAVVAFLVLAALARDPVRYGALSIAAVTWMVPELAGWVSGPEQLRTAADTWARVLPAVVLVGVVSDRDHSVADRVLARVAIAGCTAAAALRLLLVDPFRQVDCWRTCSPNPLLIGDASLGSSLELLAVVVAATGLCGVALGGLRRPARVARAVASAAVLVGMAGTGVLRLVVEESATSPSFVALLLLVQVAVGGLALLEARDRFAQWRLGGRLARLAAGLAAAPPPGSLAGVLREAVHDPGLDVRYWAPHRGCFVDAEGAAVDLVVPAGRRTTAVNRRGQPVAVLVHTARLDGDRLDRALRPALRLVLANEQLRAAALAELGELRSSRARIVERAGIERRRLERNLHDGAQQRIVSLALMVRMLAARMPAASMVSAERAQTLTRVTVEELRRIARGIYPAVLADDGLAGALSDLAEASTDLPVRVVAVPGGRCAGPVETTAYVVASAAIDDARTRGATWADVCGADVDRTLVMEIRDDAAPAAGSWATRLQDQVGALSGNLSVHAGHAGTLVRLELPCGS